MTLRKALLTAVVVFLCYELHLAETPEMVDAYLWAVVVVLMLPMTRFAAEDILGAIKTWKGNKQ
jgi:hypothetical protein